MANFMRSKMRFLFYILGKQGAILVHCPFLPLSFGKISGKAIIPGDVNTNHWPAAVRNFCKSGYLWRCFSQTADEQAGRGVFFIKIKIDRGHNKRAENRIWMMKKKLSIIFILLAAGMAHSQDRLFSQFYASPLTLNPALTGAFEGRYRMSAIYRDQWAAALEDPYATFSTSLDLRWRLGQSKSKYKDFAAVGVLFYNDKAGALDFSTTSILVSAAYHKALDPHNTQYLSIGVQAGVVQKNVNYADITFEDQFNGTTGYSNPTNERLPDNNFAFGDYAVGLNYVFSPRLSKMRFFIGGAIHHFNEPSVSFYHNENPETSLPDDKLAARYALQLSAFLPLNDAIQLQPRAIFDLQGNHAKLDAGLNVRMSMSDYKSIAMHLGGYLRPVQDFDQSTRVDALVTLLGIEFNNVLIGMSYDLNLGEVAGFNRRTFEFSVAYLGEYEDDVILCPKF